MNPRIFIKAIAKLLRIKQDTASNRLREAFELDLSCKCWNLILHHQNCSKAQKNSYDKKMKRLEEEFNQLFSF